MNKISDEMSSALVILQRTTTSENLLPFIIMTTRENEIFAHNHKCGTEEEAVNSFYKLYKFLLLQEL